MSELQDELMGLARQVAACNDEDVLSSGEDIAALYRREQRDAMDQVGITTFLQGGTEISWDHPLLVAVAEKMRDRLRSLVAWGRETGRIP